MPVIHPGENASLILMMGVTGAGKSYFINQLAGKVVVKEGHDLASCMQYKCDCYTYTNRPQKVHNSPRSYLSKLVGIASF